MRVSVLLILSAVATAQENNGYWIFGAGVGEIDGEAELTQGGRGRVGGVPTGTETDLTRLQITGWHSDCTRDYACAGVYRANTLTPRPIDVTGQVCYVNPAKEANDAVIWYSKLPFAGGTDLEDEVFAWTFTLDEAAAIEQGVMPGPCDEDGVCECGNFDNLRAGWDTITSNDDLAALCAYPATTCSYWHTMVYLPRECNVNYWMEVTLNGQLSRTCLTAVSLEEADEPSPTAAPLPTTTPPPTVESTEAPVPTSTPPPTDQVQSCINIDTPNFQGNVTDPQTCGQACQAEGFGSLAWDLIDGTLGDGRDFAAWSCDCDGARYCVSVSVDDDVGGPPTETPSCANLKITTTGMCGFACFEVIYPQDTVSVNFTSNENEQGDTYYECQCVFEDDSFETICMETALATMSPTQSPTILEVLVPSASPSGTGNIDTSAPTDAGTVVPTTSPSAVATTTEPATAEPTTVPVATSEPTMTAPEPTTAAPEPTTTAPEPTTVAPEPTLVPTVAPSVNETFSPTFSGCATVEKALVSIVAIVAALAVL